MTTAADRPRAPERCADPNCTSKKPPTFVERTEFPLPAGGVTVQDNYECRGGTPLGVTVHKGCGLTHAVNVPQKKGGAK